MQIQLPYGHTTIPFDAPSDRIISSRLSSRKPLAAGGDAGAGGDAPSNRLCHTAELAVGKKNAVIIISDHTRPVPSRDILRTCFMSCAPEADIQITLLVATGCHRGTTAEELQLKLGEQIADQEQIVVHDAFDTQKNVQIGILPPARRLLSTVLRQRRICFWLRVSSSRIFCGIFWREKECPARHLRPTDCVRQSLRRVHRRHTCKNRNLGR